jgi:hypothetical protein
MNRSMVWGRSDDRRQNCQPPGYLLFLTRSKKWKERTKCKVLPFWQGGTEKMEYGKEKNTE